MIDIEAAMATGTTCDVIRLWSEKTPDKPALLTEDGQSVSFSQLVQHMDTVRKALNESGFGCGDRIALIHPSGARYTILLFSIVSGATAVPLNPALTEPEFASHLKEYRVDAVVILADGSSAARRAAESVSIPILDVSWDGAGLTAAPRVLGAGKEDPARPGLAKVDDLAFVLGTSGTTSQSKIIPITHRIYNQRLMARRHCTKTTEIDRCITLNPMFLMNGIQVVGTAVICGGSAIFGSTFDVERFLHTYETLGPTWFNCSFTYLKPILDYVRKNLPTIAEGQFRYIRPSSGAVAQADTAAVEAIFGTPIIEMYFSTEAGLIASNPFPPEKRKPGTVGIPVECEVVIRDQSGEILPAGQEGEILVRGDSVFSGYENNDAENELVFSDGWYCTGDLGVFDQDGYLTLTGRVREMINRGGEKIMPAEVDAVLMAHPDIVDAACFAIPHPTLGAVVGAAVVSARNSDLTEKALAAFLRERLSPIKRPLAILFLNEIPRGPAGKVLRNQIAQKYEASR